MMADKPKPYIPRWKDLLAAQSHARDIGATSGNYTGTATRPDSSDLGYSDVQPSGYVPRWQDLLAAQGQANDMGLLPNSYSKHGWNPDSSDLGYSDVNGPPRVGESSTKLGMSRWLSPSETPRVGHGGFQNMFNPTNRDRQTGDDGGDEQLGKGVSSGPSIYDLMREGVTGQYSSKQEGYGEHRDLQAELTALREEAIADEQEFATETAANREDFLTELDSSRAEAEGEALRKREVRLVEESARQETAMKDALEASGIDASAAGERLQSMGIDPGDFASAAQSETTMMLHGQNMSAANVLNQMDMVAEASSQFAMTANDQASAAAMFGIGEDLSFRMQEFNGMLNQGLIDDALAYQGIADLERQALEAYEMAMNGIDIQVLQAAQAAQAAAASAAARNAKAAQDLENKTLGLAVMHNLQNPTFDADGMPVPYQPTYEDLAALIAGGFEDDYIGFNEGNIEYGQALDLEAMTFAQDQAAAAAAAAAGGDGSYSFDTPSGSIDFGEMMEFVKTNFSTTDQATGKVTITEAGLDLINQQMYGLPDLPPPDLSGIGAAAGSAVGGLLGRPPLPIPRGHGAR